MVRFRMQLPQNRFYKRQYAIIGFSGARNCPSVHESLIGERYLDDRFCEFFEGTKKSSKRGVLDS